MVLTNQSPVFRAEPEGPSAASAVRSPSKPLAPTSGPGVAQPSLRMPFSSDLLQWPTSGPLHMLFPRLCVRPFPTRSPLTRGPRCYSAPYSHLHEPITKLGDRHRTAPPGAGWWVGVTQAPSRALLSQRPEVRTWAHAATWWRPEESPPHGAHPALGDTQEAPRCGIANRPDSCGPGRSGANGGM